MKRAWFQRIRGGGCQTLVMGEKPMFATLLIFHLPLLTSLMLQLVVGGVIAEVVVVVVGCQPYPLAHSTHVFPFFSLTHSSLVSFTLPRFWVCWLLTHRPWAILVSRRHFLPLHELLNTQALAIRVLLTAMHSHAENFPPGVSWVLPTSFSSTDW